MPRMGRLPRRGSPRRRSELREVGHHRAKLVVRARGLKAQVHAVMAKEVC